MVSFFGDPNPWPLRVLFETPPLPHLLERGANGEAQAREKGRNYSQASSQISQGDLYGDPAAIACAKRLAQGGV